ncbi:hypothetical protein GCM10010924_13480 [Rhizobium wenxiniae]|uniref:Uncharacterized protein n=1 Tax=Rhizobium wenxiniae TaxID=1737357 RepID=A0A7W9Y3B2_9HYPH|nr:hypothetical protein [Rhizobium wenxiniae]MBB6161196.1 hypothetical protein [Rhizobium wenxiniae]GGF87077.1 hypothetical protein GCM10010924_13480 [Rhizobium wenxiniae]
MAVYRQELLEEALCEAVKRNPHPANKIDGKRSEQYWLEAFSEANVDKHQACSFFRNFQLESQAVKFEYQAVADEINIVILNKNPAQSEVVSLSSKLKALITTKAKGQQTSAASKLLTFIKPHDEVYIWDKYANQAVRWRNRVQKGLRDYYLDPDENHDYSAYVAASHLAFIAERQKPEFKAAVLEFDSRTQRERGPISDRQKIGFQFLERRLFDKLMYLEGQAIAKIKVSRQAREKRNDSP